MQLISIRNLILTSLSKYFIQEKIERSPISKDLSFNMIWQFGFLEGSGLRYKILCGELHIIWKPRLANIKICEPSIFFNYYFNNMFNGTFKIRLFFIFINWRFKNINCSINLINSDNFIIFKFQFDLKDNFVNNQKTRMLADFKISML